ncbi:MAG: N-acetyl-gamma-glutamyl-phosphate reductase [Rhodospirillales bacterium CG15_BIG_FIL_POST_REV_8_21_14_020_66_15]|nr:MAG: N-acetyl-gamma-glutamyl-phosphate reductase [Rhodospirillales bacterium CG15_BIG_FIL_POST_REV_8_21_14_020_66_15]
MTAKVFIDGEAGTTGLQISERLARRADVDLLRLPDDRRKDPAARAEMLNAADVAILCLPDAAAKESVALIENPETRVIDASTAHRTADGWTYGFPELDPGHEGAVANARLVANTGCYAVASVALLHPLVGAGLLPRDFAATINAVSGYSGGGRQLIQAFEDPSAEGHIAAAVRVYALGLAHKHVPEIHRYSGLSHAPIFVPTVARYRQGMIVQIPVPLWSLPGTPKAKDLQAALADHYAGRRFVAVEGYDAALATGHLEPEDLNGTNDLKLYVFANEGTGQAVLTALLDNLGKGASGQAVQCLNLMLGLDEATGLDAPADLLN